MGLKKRGSGTLTRLKLTRKKKQSGVSRILERHMRFLVMKKRREGTTEEKTFLGSSNSNNNRDTPLALAGSLVRAEDFNSILGRDKKLSKRRICLHVIIITLFA